MANDEPVPIEPPETTAQEAAIREVHEALSLLVTNLHVKWKMYRQVYGFSEERIDILNKIAASFFQTTQFIYIDQVALDIAKLLDRASMGSHRNLSLETLVEATEAWNGDLAGDFDLRDHLVRIKTQCAAFVRYRMKRIAHNDLETHLGKGKAEWLFGFSRQDIEDALREIRSLMNKIENLMNNRTVGYTHTILGIGDGEALAVQLEQLLTYRERFGRLPREAGADSANRPGRIVGPDDWS